MRESFFPGLNLLVWPIFLKRESETSCFRATWFMLSEKIRSVQSGVAIDWFMLSEYPSGNVPWSIKFKS